MHTPEVLYGFFFSPSCIFFLLLPSVIPTVVMFSNSFFSICTGESSINQGVADMFSAVLRVSPSLGDMFKLLLSNSGFMFLLPFSVFQGDTGFEIFYFFFYPLMKNSPLEALAGEQTL